MTFTPTMWNFTEYLCYLSIIALTMKEFGLFLLLKALAGKSLKKKKTHREGENREGENREGENSDSDSDEEDDSSNYTDGTLGKVLDMLNGLVKSIQTPVKKNKKVKPSNKPTTKSIPASRK